MIIVLFILIISKIFYIQVVDYKKLNKLVDSLWSRNLPIWMTYEPGSTFKIITLAPALEEKKVDLLNESFF